MFGKIIVVVGRGEKVMVHWVVVKEILKRGGKILHDLFYETECSKAIPQARSQVENSARSVHGQANVYNITIKQYIKK